MKHKWLVENFDYAKNLIDDNKLPNCLIITGNKSIGKKDLAKEINKSINILGSGASKLILNKIKNKYASSMIMSSNLIGGKHKLFYKTSINEKNSTLIFHVHYL